MPNLLEPRKDLDSGKSGRNKTQLKANKEAEFRKIRQRESCTKSTGIGIARQIAPVHVHVGTIST